MDEMVCNWKESSWWESVWTRLVVMAGFAISFFAGKAKAEVSLSSITTIFPFYPMTFVLSLSALFLCLRWKCFFYWGLLSSLMGLAIESDPSLERVVFLDGFLCLFQGGLFLATASLTTRESHVPLHLMLSRKETSMTVSTKNWEVGHCYVLCLGS